jgi:hypothetical protein
MDTNKDCRMNLKEGETYDTRGKDGGTKFTLKVKKQAKRLTLQWL